MFLANNLNIWRLEAILDTVARLQDAGKTVFLLGQFIELEGRTPVELAIDAARLGVDEAHTARFMPAEPFRLDRDYAERVRATGATYVSNRPFFFDGTYRLHDRETGELLSFDGIHLSNFGARKFGLYLRDNYPLP